MACRLAIIWTSAGLLLIEPLGTNFSEILINLCIFIKENEFGNVLWKMATILSRSRFEFTNGYEMMHKIEVA